MKKKDEKNIDKKIQINMNEYIEMMKKFMQSQIDSGLISAAHDVADGGLVVAIAEMVMKSSLGADISVPDHGNAHGWAFGEDQGRYVVAVDDATGFAAAASAAGIQAVQIGTVNNRDELKLGDEAAISITMMRDRVEGTIPNLMHG